MSTRSHFYLFLFVLCAALLAQPLALSQEATTTAAVKPAEVLPDPARLLNAVRENQKNLQEIVKNYIFRRHDDMPDMDDKGRLKSDKRKTADYEIYYLGPYSIERLLSKDGKELSASEQKKQEQEVAKQEKKARERIAKRAAGAKSEKDELKIETFLKVDRFFNLRTDTYAGRPVYAFDFEPREDFHPDGIAEKLVASLAGTIWIDEQAKQVARLDAHFVDGIKIGGGIVAALKKGGTARLEQARINDEIWLPSQAEVHLDVRVFFFNKHYNIISTFSDYRKFRTEAKITGAQEVPEK